MTRNKLLVETSVANKVGTRDLPSCEWQTIAQHLAGDFDFIVSPLSFIEVLNSLARGGEQYVLPNRRLEALSPINPLSPTFLEMPGQFVLRKVLGCSPMLKTYQPEEMAEAMVSVLRLSSVSADLRGWW